MSILAYIPLLTLKKLELSHSLAFVANIYNMSSKAITALQSIFNRKNLDEKEPIVMVTAYDAPTMRFAVSGGADIVLVGDSAAMVMLGYESTMKMKNAEMEMLVSAVSRVESDIPIIADMVWGSYHVSVEKAVKNAIDLIRAGAHAVKIEGGTERIDTVKALVDAQIPVVGHVGLTPQSLLELGGYSVQGKDFSRAQKVLEDARAIAQAGASMLVVECVPDALSRAITEELKIPIIGIGAGRHVDGQVLVIHDLLGIGEFDSPKFVRKFAHLESAATQAVKAYADAVREGSFPNSQETYHMADDVVAEMQKKAKSPSEMRKQGGSAQEKPESSQV